MNETRHLVEHALEAASPHEMRTDLGKHVSDDDVRAALHSGDLGFLHSYTTGSCVDGPGVRLVAWTTSCMFRCQYCHNPDTWTLSNGLPVTLHRAVDEVRKYAAGLKVMRGGFTVSGGEPLMQHRFVTKLLGAVKRLNVHTALQTNGFYGERLSDEELGQIDLIMLDMKAFTASQHRRVTGIADNKPVLEFCERLARLKRPMWLRYVLVPGLTAIEEEMRQMARFARDLGVVERVEILPFHQMGHYKWERLGLSYKLPATEPPSREEVDKAAAIFRAAGLPME
jgi:pyruvate formate lyase activating enzyme